MWSAHKSAHSCLDMSVDTALHTDPRPAVKIFLNFCKKSYDFSNMCLEKKKWNIRIFSPHNKSGTGARMSVLADLYFSLPCVSERVDVFMNWVHGSTSRLKALMLILPQVRRGRAGAFLLARPIRAHQTSQCVHMHISSWIFSVCVCVRGPSHVC